MIYAPSIAFLCTQLIILPALFAYQGQEEDSNSTATLVVFFPPLKEGSLTLLVNCFINGHVIVVFSL